MEVGPTCHYVMGGVEVDPDTQQSTVPGLFAVGEVSGGMHGSNRLGGNSLSDLLVFGMRAGVAAADYVRGLAGARPAVADADVAAAQETALAPLALQGGENPYAIQSDLQQTMNDLVGIIRKAEEIEQAPGRPAGPARPGGQGQRRRAAGSSTPAGTSRSTCATCWWSPSAWPRPRCCGPSRAAGTPATTTRPWSRSGARSTWSARSTGDPAVEEAVSVVTQPLPTMPLELLSLFEWSELSKYMTPEELEQLPSKPADATLPADDAEGA